MKSAQFLSLALAIAAVGPSAWAAQPQAHQAHHPADAATVPASKAKSGTAGVEMARIDAQMKTMGEMHDKMMAAKTPEERNALMAEHMTAMQEGMTMMNGMPADGMGGSMKGGMAAHHQMMEKRMKMMQSTMQMMMDRLPAAPAK